MADKWTRRRYVVLINKNKGKAIILDTFKKRLSTMRARIHEWAGVMEMLGKEFKTRMVMIRLTYAGVDDYKPGHINDYVKKLKQSLGNNLWGFAWVSEIQERGAVHYHLILVVKRGTRIPVPDKSGMWKYGYSRIETAKTPFYLLVYTGKEKQKDLTRYPKSCRLYSVSCRLPEGHTRAYYEGLRQFKKFQSEIFDQLGISEMDQFKDWEYLGATVTKGYAEKCLVPSGIEVK